jgi:hypothetical protein
MKKGKTVMQVISGFPKETKMDPDNLTAVQKLVGGFVERVHVPLTREGPVLLTLLVNEDGMLLSKPAVRTPFYHLGSPLRIIGDYVIAARGRGDLLFEALPAQAVRAIYRLYEEMPR